MARRELRPPRLEVHETATFPGHPVLQPAPPPLVDLFGEDPKSVVWRHADEDGDDRLVACDAFCASQRDRFLAARSA